VDPGFLGLTVPNLISQSLPNDLMRDLNLSKIQAELLASLLQEWNLLQQSVTHVMPAIIVIIFSKDGELIYCNDVEDFCKSWDVHTILKNGDFFCTYVLIYFKGSAAT